MMKNPTSPADGPTQAQLDQLAAKLEAHFNEPKRLSVAQRLAEWDNLYEPREAFKGLREVWREFRPNSFSLVGVIAFTVFSPIVLPFVIIVLAGQGIAGCGGYCLRKIRSQHNPPRPDEASLTRKISLHLAASEIRSYLEVANKVRLQAAPFAAHLTKYFSTDGALVGAKIRHTNIEADVVRLCLQYCPSLVDAATAQQFADYQCSTPKNQPNTRPSEGDPDTSRGTCLKCGYILIEQANGGIICARCQQKPPLCNKCGSVLIPLSDVLRGPGICERCDNPAKCRNCGGALTPLSGALPGLGYCKKCNVLGKP